MLADGTLTTMGELYEEGQKCGKVTRMGAEETVELERPLEVVALTEDGLAPQKVNLLYQGKSDSLLRLRTRTGKVLEVTPVHKLFQLTGRAEINERQARELKVPGLSSKAAKGRGGPEFRSGSARGRAVCGSRSARRVIWNCA